MVNLRTEDHWVGWGDELPKIEAVNFVRRRRLPGVLTRNGLTARGGLVILLCMSQNDMGKS